MGELRSKSLLCASLWPSELEQPSVRFQCALPLSLRRLLPGRLSSRRAFPKLQHKDFFVFLP